MDRTKADGSVNGRYVDQDISKNMLGTVLEAFDQNQTQEELVRTIEKAGLVPSSDDVEQLYAAIVKIARLESAGASIFPVQLMLTQSPQHINLRDYAVSRDDHHYLAVLQLLGENQHDVTVSYLFDADDRLTLTLYSRYTNEAGERVAGLPYLLSRKGFGTAFGQSFGGTASGAMIKVNIFLRNFLEEI